MTIQKDLQNKMICMPRSLARIIDGIQTNIWSVLGASHPMICVTHARMPMKTKVPLVIG